MIEAPRSGAKRNSKTENYGPASKGPYTTVREEENEVFYYQPSSHPSTLRTSRSDWSSQIYVPRTVVQYLGYRTGNLGWDLGADLGADLGEGYLGVTAVPVTGDTFPRIPSRPTDTAVTP
jgi:hypothetical protein